LRQYERAIEIDDNYANAWYGRGNVLLAIESYSEAESCFRKAIRLQPENIDCLINLGAALAFQEKFESALAVYRKVRELDRNLSGLEECIEYVGSRIMKLP
jgi:tetratricopeptide (TPR) repeat protein